MAEAVDRVDHPVRLLHDERGVGLGLRQGVVLGPQRWQRRRLAAVARRRRERGERAVDVVREPARVAAIAVMS